MYPALEGISKMVASDGVTLSDHFIPGGTNTMVSGAGITVVIDDHLHISLRLAEEILPQ